jgi:beta-lactamase class A
MRGRATLVAAVLVPGLALSMLAPLPMTVAGQLVDIHGRPVAGAAVVTPLLGSTTRTDLQGRYRQLAWTWPLPSGVEVQGPDLQLLTTLGGTATIHRLPRVYGRVVDETGLAVPGAQVWLVDGYGSTHLVRADRNGAFAFPSGIAPGHALLSAAAADHDQSVISDDLRLDTRARLSIALPRQLGTIALTSDPAGVKVMIDGGQTACPATPCSPRLPVGSHIVQLDDPSYVPWAQVVRLERDQVMPLQVHLERKMGTLAVTAPPGGELSVDGQQVANGPWTGLLPIGRHQLAYRGAGVWPAITVIEVQWNATVTAQLGADAVARGDPGAFTGRLRTYLQTIGGSYGVYLEDLAGGQAMGVDEDSSMEAASVIKLPVALYLLHQVDAGQIKLTDQVQLQKDDFMGGTGTLYGRAHEGDQYAYQDLLGLLIRQSDNTAWQALQRVLDEGKIDAYAASLGASGCTQASDRCTARSVAVLLGRLVRGQALSRSSGQLLLGLLESTDFNDRINYYLPGVTIAHKVGMDGNVINDAGIVFLSGHPFLIAVLTQTSSPDTGVQVIRDVARAAASYYGG